jgi:hypothetical protein
MRLLHAGVDTSVIALWLGHEQVETTQLYLDADLALKERALPRTRPLDSEPGRYRPPDALLGFLDGRDQVARGPRGSSTQTARRAGRGRRAGASPLTVPVQPARGSCRALGQGSTRP